MKYKKIRTLIHSIQVSKTVFLVFDFLNTYLDTSSLSFEHPVISMGLDRIKICNLILKSRKYASCTHILSQK